MVIGGMGDVRGCLIAGLGIGVAEVMIAQYISTDFRDAITYGLLLLVLVVRPTGIFSERQTTRA
jgi:branched-chain amino acid transport system permease protein